MPGGIFVEAAYAGRLSHRQMGLLDVSEPLNLIDKRSGQSFFQASQQIEKLVMNNIPISQVPNMPFWQDLWPGAAGDGLTATQGVYRVFQANASDWGDGALFSLDDICQPTCSTLGPFALINQQIQYGGTWSSVGRGSYHSLQLTARKQFQHGLLFDFNYTHSSCHDLVSGSESGLGHYQQIINTTYPGQQYARCTYDYPNLVNANWVWQLPVGKGRMFLPNSNRLVNAVLGGWQLSGIFQRRRGVNDGPIFGGDWNTSLWWEGWAMGSAVPKTRVGRNVMGLDGRGAPNLFADPSSVIALYRPQYTGEAGNTRNTIAGPSYTNFDMGLGKRFQMPYNEKHSIQLRIEAFNVLNSTHFQAGESNYGYQFLNINDPPSFGKIRNAINPRVVQFAGRYEF